MSAPRVIAEVRSQDGWDGLLEAFRRAVDARGTTYETTSELAGLPTRYVNKLLAPVPVKNIGRESLGPLMGATAVKILVVDDDEMLSALAGRFPKRKPGGSARYARGTMPARKKRKKSAFLGNSAWGRTMVSRQVLLRTPAQRKSLAKRAALIRWADVKAAAKSGAAAKSPPSQGSGSPPTQTADTGARTGQALPQSRCPTE